MPPLGEEKDTEVNPDPEQDKKAEGQRVILKLKFVKEACHALVFVPFHRHRQLHTTGPLVVASLGPGHYVNMPAGTAKTHKPVQVFAMEKIAVVQGTDLD